ncbi:hypothetical protein [Arthrobacter sp. Soil736]|uniref:hypothetical protein n=1 Tax=Arthrobacter sp. Soil736 TaxID=1736395 RepID=UPI000A9CA2D7|nr:hypothetical protein [Arthrobacter sp. Soil736]
MTTQTDNKPAQRHSPRSNQVMSRRSGPAMKKYTTPVEHERFLTSGKPQPAQAA